MSHILVLQHVAPEGPGRIATALAAAGIEPRIVRIDQGAAVPHTVGDARGLLVMGGPMGVYEADRYPHLTEELAAELARATADAAKLIAAADALTSRLGPVADTIFSRWAALL